MLLVARGGRGDPGPKTAGEARLESRTQTVLHLHFHLTGIIIKPSALPNSAWQGYSCSAFSPSAIFYTWLLLFPFFFFFLLYFPWRERPTTAVLTGNFRTSWEEYRRALTLTLSFDGYGSSGPEKSSSGLLVVEPVWINPLPLDFSHRASEAKCQHSVSLLTKSLEFNSPWIEVS